MKAGMSVAQLAAELTRPRASKIDYLVGTQQLVFRASDDGDVRLHGLPDGDLSVRNIAHGQFSGVLGVPKRYYDRMRTQAPDLLAINLNRWMADEPSKRMVRTIDGEVRAVLSDRFRPLDNADLAEAVLPALRDCNATVESANITEARMYLKIVRHDLREDLMPPGAEWGTGHASVDVIEAGLVISNSEVGMGSLKVSPALHTVRCTNLAVFSDDAVAKYHIGRALGGDSGEQVRRFITDATRTLQDRAIFATVRDTATASLDGTAFRRYVADLRATKSETLTGDVPETIERIGNRLDLSQPEQKGVLDYLIAGGDLSQYGVQDAITSMAGDADDYDRSCQLEEAGAEVITLSPSQWRALQDER